MGNAEAVNGTKAVSVSFQSGEKPSLVAGGESSFKQHREQWGIDRKIHFQKK